MTTDRTTTCPGDINKVSRDGTEQQAADFSFWALK
jgi:hypothetical protein